MAIAEIISIESAPEYRLERARVALEQAQREYDEALKASCHPQYAFTTRDQREKMPLNGNQGFSLLR